MSERVKTGIPGLDGILNGGFIKGTNILVSGGTGTGKTIFSMQFVYMGAVLYDEPGVFVTLEERPSELRREVSQFGWDLKHLENHGKIAIIDAASSKAGIPTNEPYALRRGFDINELAKEIYRAAKDLGSQRIALDSISALGVRFDDILQIRTSIFKLSALLRELEVTSIMTTEIANPNQISRFGVEEFIAQGVIILHLDEEHDELRRSLIVRKMRGTSHSLKRHPFEITPKGIVVKPVE
ncbi:MAG: ATPase domain-containing protein [Candidatus Baldrarchaeia archaeon]|nr:gas vesicle protein GvpD [Candidatus Baldrarchaeota archaeon]OYT29300.1 MAG: ATPase [Thermofilum sp. ex4484_82]OYT39218.1 MAG: ATPase [Archaeoglobales archaeon ex4484_92]